MPRETFRHIIVTEEKVAQINPENKMLANTYLNSLKKSHSPKTVKVYKSNYNIFFCWNLEFNNNKSFIDLRKIEISNFFDYCVEELKFSPARYANMHSSLCALSTFIENMLDDDYPNFKNIVKKIPKLAREKVREKTIISETEIDKFLKKLVKEERYQEACYIALVMSCGARFSEVLRITTDLIDENHTVIDGIFLETKEPIRTKGRGANGKMLKKYLIADIFLPYYKLWKPEREKIMKENKKSHTSMFINSSGDPITETAVRRWFTNWSNELQIDFYCHSLRHYWTTWLSNKNVSPQLIQSLQGWESADMVNLYDDTSFLEKNFELNDLKSALKKNKKE